MWLAFGNNTVDFDMSDASPVLPEARNLMESWSKPFSICSKLSVWVHKSGDGEGGESGSMGCDGDGGFDDSVSVGDTGGDDDNRGGGDIGSGAC